MCWGEGEQLLQVGQGHGGICQDLVMDTRLDLVLEPVEADEGGGGGCDMTWQLGPGHPGASPGALLGTSDRASLQ